MDVHQNARTTPHGRRLMIERLAEGWSVARLAAAAGVTAKTVGKWRDRHALEGEVGLLDRSSRPHRSPTRLPDSAVAEIIQLRRQRLSGPAIARRLGRPVSTVGCGSGILVDVHPAAPSRGCERGSHNLPAPHRMDNLHSNDS